jgi:hypothetical protein
VTCKFKESLLLLLDSCTAPLPTKLHALSLLANQERLWTFDLDKSQVRGRYDSVRDIKRSHCQPSCACMLLIGSEHMLAPSWSREIALSRFSVSCVSVFGTGESLIPTIWGLVWDFTFRMGRGSCSFPGETCPAAWLQRPEVGLRTTTFGICKWTQTAEFLDKAGKRALKTGTVVTT